MGGRPRSRRTEEAVAEAASLDDARAAAGATAREPAGPGRPTRSSASCAARGCCGCSSCTSAPTGRATATSSWSASTQLTGGLVAVNPNTMYPLLRALEAEGLVAGEWEHPERRSRRFYRLTEAGEAERERSPGRSAELLDRLAASIEAIRRGARADGPGAGADRRRRGASCEAERLWYDTSRWASFVDGFGHLREADAALARRRGARAVGLAARRAAGGCSSGSSATAAGDGQDVEVEDERMTRHADRALRRRGGRARADRARAALAAQAHRRRSCRSSTSSSAAR